MLLINVVEKTGMGAFPHVAAPERKMGERRGGPFDQEVRFTWRDQLAERAAEIDRKNKELIQVKKLAAIGTLAAGVRPRAEQSPEQYPSFGHRCWRNRRERADLALVHESGQRHPGPDHQGEEDRERAPGIRPGPRNPACRRSICAN